MRPPVVTSWVGPDGITVHGIVCIDDGVIRLKMNQSPFENCPICYEPPTTTHGKHRICCLPCGHMYGLSCIKKWLRVIYSYSQCPQCNTVCPYENPILLYPPGLRDTTAHQETSSATLFPFTEQGLLEFKKYEHSRMLDARSLQADDITHTNILVRKHNGLAHCARELQRRHNYHLTRAEKLEGRPDSLGLADASRSRASRLLVQRAATLEQLVIALRQRSDALGQRYDAFESRVGFGCQMYEEHHNGEKEIAQAKQALEMKKNLAEKEAAKAKMNDQKEAEKKLNDDIVDVPEEVTAEDVAEVPDEEDIMESDEEDIMESEEEDIMESEEEESEEDQEEEAEQLEEMRPPVVTSWVGPDGITVHGLMCIDDGVIRLKNQWRFEDCSICYKPSTYHGKHRICVIAMGYLLLTRTIDGGDSDEGLGVGNVGGLRVSYLSTDNYYILNIKDRHRDNRQYIIVVTRAVDTKL